MTDLSPEGLDRLDDALDNITDPYLLGYVRGLESTAAALEARLEAAEAERTQVVEWFGESGPKIDSACTIAALHHCPYTGEPAPKWLIEAGAAWREVRNGD